MAVTPARRYDKIAFPLERRIRSWKDWFRDELDARGGHRTSWKKVQCGGFEDGEFSAQGIELGLTSTLPQVVIVQPSDTGSKAHPFPFAIVAGIERYPQKVTRRMGKKLVDRRSRVKPFIKVVNYNHLMPTRYTLELEGLKGAVSADTFKEVSQREDAKKTVKKALEDRYTSGKNRWFFTPLRTSIATILSSLYASIPLLTLGR